MLTLKNTSYFPLAFQLKKKNRFRVKNTNLSCRRRGLQLNIIHVHGERAAEIADELFGIPAQEK